MPIYRFTFPILNYNEDGVFEKHVYFEGSRCPYHTEVVERLEALHADELRMAEDGEFHGPFTFEFKACLEAIEKIVKKGINNQLPWIGVCEVMTNCFTAYPDVERFGEQPISVQKIRPNKFEEPFVSWYAGGKNY